MTYLLDTVQLLPDQRLSLVAVQRLVELYGLVLGFHFLVTHFPKRILSVTWKYESQTHMWHSCYWCPFLIFQKEKESVTPVQGWVVTSGRLSWWPWRHIRFYSQVTCHFETSDLEENCVLEVSLLWKEFFNVSIVTKINFIFLSDTSIISYTRNIFIGKESGR